MIFCKHIDKENKFLFLFRESSTVCHRQFTSNIVLIVLIIKVEDKWKNKMSRSLNRYLQMLFTYKTFPITRINVGIKLYQLSNVRMFLSPTLFIMIAFRLMLHGQRQSAQNAQTCFILPSLQDSYGVRF